MSELREVPQDTPILDAGDAMGGKVGLIAAIVRPLKRVFDRIRQRRTQRRIDKRWHDDLRVGKPERDEP